MKSVISHDLSNYYGIKAKIASLPHEIHQGSWNLFGIGLPDFGLTEGLTSNRTKERGSNLLGSNVQQFVNNPISPITIGRGGETVSTLGASTQNTNTNTNTNTNNTNKTTSSNSGSGGNTSVSVPSNNNNNDAIFNEINNQYNSAISRINDLTSNLYRNRDSINNQINQNADTSRQTLANSLNDANSQVDLSQQGGEQRKQDAISAARNLYNELVQGGQQRFGGASSAGEAYQALAGRELMKNNQQTQTDFNTFMGQIAQARNSLQTQYQNSLASLEQQRNDALAQAQRDFNDQLTQINGMKDQANSNKASARLDAITSLRNQIFQINLQTAQNSQTVKDYASQLASQLSQYEQAAAVNTNAALSGQQDFSSATTTDPLTAYGISSSNGQGVPQQYVGMMNNRDDKDKQMIGYANPFIRRDQLSPFQAGNTMA